jgi:hypothetical protein
MQTLNEQQLDVLLEQWQIENFTAHELLWLPRRGCIDPVPKRLALHIAPTLDLAERIRAAWAEYLGEDGDPRIDVLSCWRPIPYNRLVGSDDTSMHPKFRAMDITPMNGRIEEFLEIAGAEVKRHRNEGRVTGFGLYKNFCHIDTGYYGYNRTWDHR